MPLGPLPYAAKLTARGTDANGVLLLTLQVVDAAGVERGAAKVVPVPADDGTPSVWDVRRVSTQVATRQAVLDAGGQSALLDAFIAQGAPLADVDASGTVPLPIINNWQVGTFQRGPGPFTGDGMMTSDRWRIDLGVGSSISCVSNTANTSKPSSGRCLAITYTDGGGAAGHSRLFCADSESNTRRGYALSTAGYIGSSVPNGCRLALFDGVTPGTTKPVNTGGNGLGGFIGCGQTGTRRQFGAYHTGSGYELLKCENFVPADNNTVLYEELWLEKSGTYYLDDTATFYGSRAGKIPGSLLTGEGYAHRTFYEVKVLYAGYLASGPSDVRRFPLPLTFVKVGLTTGNRLVDQQGHANTNCTVSISAIANVGYDGGTKWGYFTVTPGAAGTVIADELWEFVSDKN